MSDLSNVPDDWGRFEGDKTFGVGECCDACGDPLSVHVCRECGELADCYEDYCEDCEDQNENERTKEDDDDE